MQRATELCIAYPVLARFLMEYGDDDEQEEEGRERRRQ
jgi:hypothetical protein